MAVEYPIRTRIDDKDLDRLIAKLRAAGKQAELTEQQIEEISSGVRKSVKTTSGEVSKVNSSLSGITSQLAGVAKGFILAFATQAITNLNARLEENAARLEAIDRRATVVFGRYKEQVEAVGRSIANELGLSESAFLGATAAAADLLVPMGFAREEAATLSVELIKLSGALSEWTGGQRSATEVSSILTKAILGEREQLKELGISIREADVQSRLLEKGQKQLTGQALEQAKALATLELITEKSTDAQTAFAEGGDSLTRQVAKRKAAVEDLGNAFSQILTPAITASAKAGTTFLTTFKQIVTSDDLNFFEKFLAFTSPRNFERAGVAARKAAGEVQTGIKDLATQIQELENKIALGEKLLNAVGADPASQQQLKDAIATYKKELGDLRKELSETTQEETAIPLITQINEQLDVQRRLRDEALTEEDLAKANRNIQKLEEELKRLKSIGKELKDLKGLREDQFDLIDPVASVGENASAQAKRLRDAIDKAFGPDFLFSPEDFKERGNVIVERFKDQMDQIEEVLKESLKKREEALSEHQQKKQAIEDAGFQVAFTFIDTLNQVNAASDQIRLNRIQELYDRELELAGDNETARRQIQKKREQEERALLERQARRQQRNSLFQLAISEGPAIGKTAAQLGFPLAIPFIAAIGALFAVQFSKLKSLEVPRFAKGKYKLSGPGTETSDEIPAMLSVNETVVQAERSKRFGWLLQPMVEDGNFTEAKLRELVDRKLPSRLKGDLFVNASVGPGTENRQLKEIERAIKRIPGTQINLDKNGFSTWVNQNGKWNEYVNERYRV